eukprot:SAG31_NODE_7785_length_1596_cov_3.307281_2_plen_334_part_00
MLLGELNADWLIVGGVLTATGSMCFFQHAIGGISHFLPAKSFLVISLSCTLFDASAGIFWLAKLVFDVGVPLYAIGLFLICLAVFLALVIIRLRTSIGMDDLELQSAHETNADSAALSEDRFAYTPLARRRLCQQFCTLEFGFIMTYMAVHMTRSNLYLGILTPFFESIGKSNGVSGATVQQYVMIATLIVPCGCLWVVVVEKLIKAYKGCGGAFVVHVLACAYGGLMFVPILWVQVLGALIYGFYRALLFSVIAVFNIGGIPVPSQLPIRDLHAPLHPLNVCVLAEVFGLENVGPINGVMYSLTTIFSFVIDPVRYLFQCVCRLYLLDISHS